MIRKLKWSADILSASERSSLRLVVETRRRIPAPRSGGQDVRDPRFSEPALKVA